MLVLLVLLVLDHILRTTTQGEVRKTSETHGHFLQLKQHSPVANGGERARCCQPPTKKRNQPQQLQCKAASTEDIAALTTLLSPALSQAEVAFYPKERPGTW